MDDDPFLDLLDQLVHDEPDELFGCLHNGIGLPFSDLDWPQPQQGQPGEHSTSRPAAPPAEQPAAAQQLRYTSPDAQTQYANTAASIAAAQAQMAATPGHKVQLQHVVSATSHQLQQMAQRAALLVASKAPAQAAASGAAAAQFSMPPAPPQQQQQQKSMPMQQQQQGVSMQQQQQQQQQQRQTSATPFSAATMAKAAAIASSSDAAAAPTPQAQPFGFAGAQGAGLQASAAAAGGLLQRPSGLTGALNSSGVLDPSLAAAAAAAVAQQQAQQQGLGLVLPEHFKGVMLTPAGAVTGVAVGPNLVQWVQGLQQLASQQQQVRAAGTRQKAANKKDKVLALQAQVSAKQAQLQALSLDNLALVAKARALEQLVKSAGDDVTLMEQQLATLALKQETQEDSIQAAAAAAAAVAAIQGQAAWPQQPSAPQQQQQQQQQQQRPVPQAPMQAQQQPKQQQQQQQQSRGGQAQAGAGAQFPFQQLHHHVLQHLMDTPLESLEDILGMMAPAAASTPAATAAASAPAQVSAAAGAGGSVGVDGQRQQPSAQQQQQQQQQQAQQSPHQVLYQEWSPPVQQQQQQPMQAPFLSPQQQQQQQTLDNPAASSGTAHSSEVQPGSAASTGRQSSFGDVSSAPSSTSHPAVSSSSDPGLHGNLFGTAASAAAAVQAAAAGLGGGLLLAVGAGSQQEQLFEAAAMAYPNAFRPTQQLEEKLPEIQAVHKRVMLQLMPLLLQVQQERISYNLQNSGSSLPPQQVLSTPAMQELTRVMLQYSKDIHTFAIANRVSTYELYTLNIETGQLGQPPPEGHWKRVAVMLKDRLSPQALADLCVARQLYSSTLMRIKHQRQLLVLQLAQLISNAHSRPTEQTYRTDSVFYGVSGPHCEGCLLLDSIQKNMRKEYTLEGVYQWMTHHIIPMQVLAELVVHSYPFKADIHMTLQELMRDQPMPALTALQQLQLRQLQEQSSAVIQAQQQQQQVAAIVAQQQQAAEQLRALQQQRGLLAAGGVAAGASYTGMMAL